MIIQKWWKIWIGSVRQKTSEVKKREIPWREITVGVFTLVQIFMIIRHEDVNIITSKALNYVFKARV